MNYRGEHACSLCFVLFINNLLTGIQSKEHVLLDMRALGGELGWLTSPHENGWEIVQTVVNGSLLYTYSVCNVASEEEEDNWLRTTFIQRRPDVQRVSVEMRFVVRDCGTFEGAPPGCRETFGLYLAEADSDVGTSFRKGTFRKVGTVAPDEVTAGGGGGRAAVRVNVEVRSVGPLSRRGFYLAFQDGGACVALLALRVVYTSCPPTRRGLAAFTERVSGEGLTAVEGECVQNAVAPPQAPPRMYCTVDGDWVVPVGECLCRAGHQPLKHTCQACESGYYKSSVSNELCRRCPGNTLPAGPAALLCPCRGGFYRAPSDPPSAACSAPPSAPRDLEATPLLTSGSVQLTWRPPELTGGRSDISYSVWCEVCEGGVCVGCGGGVRYDPARTGLIDLSVTLSYLQPQRNYTITVETLSGVTQLSQERATATISTILPSDGVAKILSLHVEESSASSLSLSWSAEAPPHRYELMYRKKEEQSDVTTYTVLVLEQDWVRITDLSPGSAYMFRLQRLGPDGHPSSVSAEHEFHTLSLPESQAQSSSMVAMGVIAGGGVMLIIVVVILLLHKRKLSSSVRQSTGGNYFTCQAEKLSPLRSGVDPHVYEDPCAAALKLTTQIHPNHVSMQTVIGAGEFGEVFRGVLKLPGRREVAVAIKTLKQGYSEKQRQGFLSEASIMGQFCHQNIVRLEGVVTKSPHAMIITELMENGALDAYLRDHDGEFSMHQLVSMLSGVAAGMKHLSDMSYVHRDLAARNVLVNSQLHCKVSDFGLSRVLQDLPEGTYTTCGGKIPIRWTAPEAIAYRKFTSASDVWSFGIVMWEVMAFGERPYWDMNNQEVMKVISEGFRLPAPLGCPSAVHHMMLQCWQQEGARRPTFPHLLTRLHTLLQSPHTLTATASIHPRGSICLPSISADGAPFRTVVEWLEAMNMGQYGEMFNLAGVRTMQQVQQLQLEDIRKIGVPLPGHRRRIASSIMAMQESVNPQGVCAV